MCFKWAVLSALHPSTSNSNRVSNYQQFENELNFTGIDFPVIPKQVGKFERQNDVSINVYILKKNGKNFDVSPCHVTNLKKEKHVNLLLLQDYYVDENEEEEVADDGNDDDDEDTPPPRFHYVWIKDLSRLVRRQLTSHKRKAFVCDRCLCYFHDANMLRLHEVDCTRLNKSKINMPSEKDNTLSFKNFTRKSRVPYVIYADIESLLKPLEGAAFQEHQAYSIGYYVKCSFDDSLSCYKSYRQRKDDDDETPAEWFVKNLKALSDSLQKTYGEPKTMDLTFLEKKAFAQAKTCHICEKPFTADKEAKVRDHCHLTGRYRGAAHNSCNLNYKDAKFIPVVFHNLTGYDSHFIIKEISTSTALKGRVTLIAENKERYISFMKHIEGSDINFRFIDSFRFMASSLEKLASYLENLDIVEREFRADGYTSEQIALLRRKGVFPYDYVSSFDKLQHTELPSKDDFYSELCNSDITDDEYKHAQNVWNVLNVRTLGEYSDIYLKTDVLLLADVFENFRSTCIEAYGLDPAYYFTTPGLTWDAMLKHTKIKLELLTDVDMLMFVERGIRGGISQCSNRYAKANNSYMRVGYNEREEDVYLMYYDVNNLYGWAMTQALPYGGFEWVDRVDSNFFDVPDDHDVGYILEVDLDYPESIQDAHRDLPMCPEHRAPPGSKQEKLMTTLHEKTRYIVHYRALKQALTNGLVLKKVHRALRFKQSAWLKPYVELNTEKRKQARNEFEKLFFKLMINAVYGKTMENERKRVDVKLVSKWKGRYGAESLIAKPNFRSRSIFDENLVAVQLERTEITIRKPIYVGLCVLDLSKIVVYDFHYSYMRRRVGERCKLLYTDTDSLIYEIRGVNMYDVMKQDLDKFDTSDYPENNQFAMPRVNKKVIGIMKDECNGSIMTEFIGLRSKMYSILVQSNCNDDNDTIKKAKGVKGHVIKTSITFDDYRRCLFEEEMIHREQCNIRSRLHVVRTERGMKLALSAHDDKRYLIPGETDTLPWGHYRMRTCKCSAALRNTACACAVTALPESSVVGKRVHKETRQVVEHSLSIDEPVSKKLRTEL